MNTLVVRMISASFALSLGFGSLGFGSLASAQTPRTMRNLERAVSNLSRQTSPHKLAPLCADFSGTWQGSCLDDDGMTEDAKVTISQEGRGSVTMDGYQLDIGGMNSMQKVPQGGNPDALPLSMTMSYSWNDAQTRLLGMVSMTFSITNGSFAGAGKNSMWLAGDQLRIKDEEGTPLITNSGLPELHLVKQDCTYSRVPARD